MVNKYFMKNTKKVIINREDQEKIFDEITELKILNYGYIRFGHLCSEII